MSTQFILRFDDVSPGMAWQKFEPFKARLQDLGIKCVLGVVPDCQDVSLNVEPTRGNFFDYVRSYKEFGDTIAQHGCFHVYSTKSAGLLGINHRSEFAGHSFDEQLALLSLGKNKLQLEGVWEPYFMAPAHSFDDDTIDALKTLGFIALTDGYGFSPYRYRGMTLVPQLTAAPLNLGFGCCTICVHINTMTDPALERLIKFVEDHQEKFVDFKEVVANHTRSSSSLLAGLGRGLTQMVLKSIRLMRRARA
jgi:predicted deacetylase